VILLDEHSNNNVQEGLNEIESSRAELRQEIGEGEAEEELETVEEQVVETTDRLDVLINLLIKKNLITEDELEAEYEAWLKDKGEGDEED